MRAFPIVPDDFSFDPSGTVRSDWLVRAALTASGYGLLITSSDRRIIGANRQFGDLFDLDFREATHFGFDGWRDRIAPRVFAPADWRERFDQILADPQRKWLDEIEFRTERRRTIISCSTAPIPNDEGTSAGRIWTFRDVTREVRQREINDLLLSLNSEFVADPNESIRRALKALGTIYPDTTAILSIREGDCMRFLAVETDNPTFDGVTQNKLEDSFCQYALELQKPLIIQDARQDPTFSRIPAIHVGLTRYLGAPIYGDKVDPLGTLCILDGFSEDQLDDLDLQFVSLLGVKISSDLMRQRHVEERVAEHRAQLLQQKTELSVIHEAFDAMKEAFELGLHSRDVSGLVRSLAVSLSGSMGHEGAIVSLRRPRERSFRGIYASRDGEHRRSEVPADALERAGSRAVTSAPTASPLRHDFGEGSIYYGIRKEEGVGEILVAFAGAGTLLNQGLAKLLRASVIDQVSLVLGAHVLQSDLHRARGELGATQRSLVEQEKLAVAGALAAGAAHDIRNILSSLSLLLSPGGALSESGLSAVREQISRFDLLAYRLLSYAKPRMLVRQPVDLPKLLEGVAGLTSGQFRVAKADLRIELEADLPPVAGDPHEYEQVFVNLILNGVQSIRGAGGVVRIRARLEGDSVSIRVSDTGIGIAPEIRRRLFEPFSSTRSDGFGLGLYSCKRIVEQHGGQISARKNPGKGSTFTILLPVDRATS